MGKIIAVGGGEMGRPKDTGGFYPLETLPIDKEIIKLSGKKNPKLLFLPTASGDSHGYFEVVKKYFGQRLGCECDVLYLKDSPPSYKEIRSKILSSDIIYVGGGNTLNMLNIWNRLGVNKIMQEAYKRDIVLAGVSAGAICWARYASSDSRPRAGKNNYGFIKIQGLGLIPLTLSPHHTREIKRKKAIINIMNRTPGVGVALDDCSALEIISNKYRVITSKASANAHRVFSIRGKVHFEVIPKGEFRSFDELIKLKK